MKSSNIGGQAVIEGVMMKHEDHYAIALRLENQEIHVKKDYYQSSAKRLGLDKVIFLRGILNLYDSLKLGSRILSYSSSFFMGEEEKQQESKVSKAIMLLFSIGVTLLFFIVLPYFLSQLFRQFDLPDFAYSIVEGFFRLGIFLLYITLIGQVKDIKRVYQYHGAEHKCISCIENGKELTVDNVRRSSKVHQRCGTSFLLFTVLISIFLFMFIKVQNPLPRLGLRILLIPVIAGIAYEIIRIAGRSNALWVQLISYPGLLVQKLTTKEPSDDMIEVAIAAVEAVFDWRSYIHENFTPSSN